MKRVWEISAKQEKLIAFLLTERTIDEACNKAGVAVTTYWRWTKDHRFLKEYRRARRDILESAISRLQGITTNAIDTLERNLHCENPSVETRTAAIILEQAIKGLAVLDVEQRIEYLEQLAKAEENLG
jgi:hypothetical protein